MYADDAARQRAYRARRRGEEEVLVRPDVERLRSVAWARRGSGKSGAAPSAVVALCEYVVRLERQLEIERARAEFAEAAPFFTEEA